MRFLAKDPGSALTGAKYAVGGHNDGYRRDLLAEQHGRCAYSERVVGPLDTPAIEHFDARLKGTDEDGYLNHYVVLQRVNQLKRSKERRHVDAAFHQSRFFQERGAMEARVQYVRGEGVFEEIDPEDTEACHLVDFLCFNDPDVFEDRRKHVVKLRDLFELAGWDSETQVSWLRDHPEELHYVSALQVELELDLIPLVGAG